MKLVMTLMILMFVLVSCGKKGCPKYSGSDNEKCDPIFKN